MRGVGGQEHVAGPPALDQPAGPNTSSTGSGRAPAYSVSAALRLPEALGRLGIGHLAERAYPELSGGERRLVLIARALAQQADLLILDEPTAHLEFGRLAAVMDLVRELAAQGLAVVVTTHDPHHAFQVSTAVLLMPPGDPVELGPPNVVLTQESLSRTYARPVRVRDVDERRMCIT